MIKTETYRLRRYWLLAPAVGVVLFLVLYVVAAQYYPGGSQADQASRGFDWVHNYWCNLLNERGVNGEPSASRPIALSAMGVLCVTMGFFAWIFPTQVPFGRKVRVLVQGSGIAGMVLAMFIFTEAHDWLINISCLLGVISAVGTMVGLRMMKWNFLFRVGILNLVMVVVNNVLYHYKPWIGALPVVQKITFLMFLGWVFWISVKLYSRAGNNHKFGR